MEEKFKNNSVEWQKNRLEEKERAVMLDNIFKTPVKSPFYFYRAIPAVFVFIFFMVSVASASKLSLPGNLLYPLKTQVLEPLIGAFNFLPESKVRWEEDIVMTRLNEIELLEAEDRLDDKKIEETQKKIDEGVIKFDIVAEKASQKTATSTEERLKKYEDFKNNFKERLEESGRNSEKMRNSTERRSLNVEAEPNNQRDLESGRDFAPKKSQLEEIRDNAIKALEKTRDKRIK